MSIGGAASLTGALGGGSAAMRAGNLAAWALVFYGELPDGSVDAETKFILTSDDYDAKTIEAALPGGLEGGTYNFVLEGVTDEHYKKIAQGRTNSPRILHLHLWWKDVNASLGGYLANVAGITGLLGPEEPPEGSLVAKLRIRKVTRQRGERRYEAVIRAREQVYDRLDTPMDGPLNATSLRAALDLAGDLAGVAMEFHDVAYASQYANGEGISYGDRGTKYVRVFQEAVEKELATLRPDRGGRGLLLIRDGVLHVGPRPIPLGGAPGSTKDLTASVGFIEAARQEASEGGEPAGDGKGGDAKGGGGGGGDSGEGGGNKQQFKVTLKGRPDIKPGDLVRFDPPPEEVVKTGPSFGEAVLGGLGASLAGSFLPSLGDTLSDDAITIYVTGVRHKLGRTAAFSTEVTGVQIQDPAQPWDGGGKDRRTATPDGATAAAAAIRARAAAEAGAKQQPEVGEVRRHNLTGTAEPPAQTVTVWRGVDGAAGGANGAGRFPVRRKRPATFAGVPYVTPFAWGSCGLVLPRYPGTRVFLTHRNGDRADAVDTGALWESGKAPESQPGDWWLSLPADVAADARARIEDAEEPPALTCTKASHDLIDADGNRVITVGELTVRVGADALTAPGTRPARPEASADQGHITIEHLGGAKIVMKSDGTILISGKNLQIKAEQDVSIEARKVDVKVSDKMDVHG